MFTIPITFKQRQMAEQFQVQHSQSDRKAQIYCNILAVLAVNYYCQCLEIPTDLGNSESWNPVIQSLADIADLLLPGIGQLECRPVAWDATVVEIPAEVLGNRIAYVIVALNSAYTEAKLLGFLPSTATGKVSLTQLQPLEDLPDVLVLPNSQTMTQLSHWLQHQFEESWQAIEAILTPRKLAFKGFREQSKKDKVERAKTIDLGLLVERQQLALLVSIWTEENQEKGVLIQVCPTGEQRNLPAGLKLTVTLESDEAEVIAREADNLIQLEFSELPGKQFTVQVSLDHESITEKFVV